MTGGIALNLRDAMLADLRARYPQVTFTATGTERSFTVNQTGPKSEADMATGFQAGYMAAIQRLVDGSLKL
jgi:hypothetical protein